MQTVPSFAMLFILALHYVSLPSFVFWSHPSNASSLHLRTLRETLRYIANHDEQHFWWRRCRARMQDTAGASRRCIVVPRELRVEKMHEMKRCGCPLCECYKPFHFPPHVSLPQVTHVSLPNEMVVASAWCHSGMREFHVHLFWSHPGMHLWDAPAVQRSGGENTVCLGTHDAKKMHVVSWSEIVVLCNTSGQED